MTATDTLRSVIRDLEAKAKEMELDKRLTTFADQADHYLRVAASRAGEYAAENRERVEATLDKAGSKVDEKTDGKYHAYVGKVRAGVLSGVDWVAEQRDAAESETESESESGAAAGDATASGPATPTSAGRTATADAAPAADASPAPRTTSTDAGATASATTSEPGDAADVTPTGSADSDAWVDVTDEPPVSHDPRTEGPTDPR